ncbi:MtrAB system histidine kinase MtrB [Paraoerskovia marina]|uniref:MtrAB system histidine kinase MtrB n=1 Tax=Paraoerskovia marina TaxID=545619 RepID=UPI000694C16A|nr:MtrAB system histidine kinase MtrB [Paraoerskovia marina]
MSTDGPSSSGRSSRRRASDLVRSLAERARLGGARAVWVWRSSLQLRVVSSALAVGILTVAALGAYMSTTIRDGVFDQRLAEVDDESARSTAQAQSQFDAAPATSPDSVQTLLYDMLWVIQASGSGSRHVFLWSEDDQSGVIDVSTAPQYDDLVTEEMRERTVETADPDSAVNQVLQSVAIPLDPGDPDSAVVPGVVVGTTVNVPVEGTFELYYLYSFEPEQETLDFMQRSLFSGAVVLVVLLGVIAWMVTRQAVDPVRRAARVAERLADGLLDERLTVRGHDEMATLARSFNEMAQSLQEQINRMEELSLLQRRFVSDVSHELRTPLTTVRMASEVLYASRDDFDPAAKRSAELMQTQLDRFEELLADLLEISRFDAGAAMLDAERRDLRDVVDRAVDNAQTLAASKGVWLAVDLGDEPASADIDPRRVERVVRNLLNNAIEHAEQGPVEVRVAAEPRSVAVVVRDYGVGMTVQQVDRVFDRFWRADPARARTTGGTGLGLAISLEDARLHGGWLDVWARPDQGSAFRLTLPRRAGIVLDGSPLELVPATADRRDDPHPPSGAIRMDASDPTSLPAMAPGQEES